MASTPPPEPDRSTMPQLPDQLWARTANVRYIYLDDTPLPDSFNLP